MEIGSVLPYLAAFTVRSLGLAIVAWAAMALARVKSPATRHTVWTVVTGGMLALAAASAALPELPVRVWRASPPPPAAPASIPVQLMAPSEAESRPLPWDTLAAAVYLPGLLLFTGRLLYGYLLARRLVRASRVVPGFETERVYASPCISVPLTVGWIRPKILLPKGWDAWPPQKLEAVLVHEQTHIMRVDWAIAVFAALNRCVFWFHPLAWWIERRLSVLAELACDDASLSRVASRECYAQTLLDMAAAVRSGKGRVTWEAIAMAKAAEVRVRVERILDRNRDDSRQIQPRVTRAQWFTVAACVLPLVCTLAVVRPARVRAQAIPPAPPKAAQSVAPAQEAAPPQPPSATRSRAAAEAEARAAEQQLQQRINAEVVRIEAARAENEMRSHLNQLIINQRAEIEVLTQQLSPNHPTLKASHARLEVLEKRYAEAQKAAPRGDGVADRQQSVQELVEKLQQLQQRMMETRLQAEQQKHAGSITTGPSLISRRDPEYTPAARQAGIQGSVELSVTIGTDGIPRDIQVIRPLDAGLDSQAIECVKLGASALPPATVSPSPPSPPWK